MNVSPERRNPHQVMMLYHAAGFKGSAQGIEALEHVKKRVPDLEATLFGTPPAPKNLPKWMTYHRQPQQQHLRSLYNEAAIFLSTSHSEGWGLSSSEAMMAGAALAGTDIGGHQEFAEHEKTALLSPPNAPAALATNLERLLRDQKLRIALAYSGHKSIQRFTWERAVTSFEKVVQGHTL